MAMTTGTKSPASQTSALTALAMLKVNWDHAGQSYLDSLSPLIVSVLSGGGGTGRPVADIRDGLRDEFGLLLPHATVEALLTRLARRGVIKRIDDSYEASDSAQDDETSVRRAAMLRKQGTLVREFLDFAHRKGETLTAEFAEERLLRQIEHASVPVLKSWLQAEPYRPDSEEPDYVAASFVLHVSESNFELFSYLVDMVQGNMLAASLYYAPSLTVLPKRFGAAFIVLDTPVLFQMLGWEGPEKKEAASEMLSLIKQYGGDAVCFRRTLAEMRGVLFGVENALTPDSQTKNDGGPVRAYFIEQGFGPSDIRLESESLETSLREIGIRVIEPPEYTLALGVDEAALERTLQLKGKRPYANDQALVHDIDALTAIWRWRGGEQQGSLETCKAIFITSNDRVFRTAKDFFQISSSSRTWPLALLDTVLCTILWLKGPQAAEALPQRQLIANAHAALIPTTSLWKRYLSELEKLSASSRVVERDYSLLRYSLDAQHFLMEETLGREDRVNESTVFDVLRRSKAALTQEHFQEASQPMVDEIVALREQLHVQTQVSYEQEELLRGLSDRETARRTRRDRAVKILGLLIATLVCALLIGCVLAFAWVGLPWIGPGLENLEPEARTWVRLLADAGALVGIVTLLYGGSIGAIYARLPAYLVKVVRARD